MSGDSTVARITGAAGILAQVAAAYVFLLIPALTVPSPATYLFFAAWALLMVLATSGSRIRRYSLILS